MRRQEVLIALLPALFRNSESVLGVSPAGLQQDTGHTRGPGESALMFNHASQETPRTRARERLWDGR